MYRIRVNETYIHNWAQVSGQRFTRQWLEVNDASVNEEISTSPVLEVAKVEVAKPVRTRRARSEPKAVVNGD